MIWRTTFHDNSNKRELKNNAIYKESPIDQGWPLEINRFDYYLGLNLLFILFGPLISIPNSFKTETKTKKTFVEKY